MLIKNILNICFATEVWLFDTAVAYREARGIQLYENRRLTFSDQRNRKMEVWKGLEYQHECLSEMEKIDRKLTKKEGLLFGVNHGE